MYYLNFRYFDIHKVPSKVEVVENRRQFVDKKLFLDFYSFVLCTFKVLLLYFYSFRRYYKFINLNHHSCGIKWDHVMFIFLAIILKINIHSCTIRFQVFSSFLLHSCLTVYCNVNRIFFGRRRLEVQKIMR